MQIAIEQQLDSCARRQDDVGTTGAEDASEASGCTGCGSNARAHSQVSGGGSSYASDSGSGGGGCSYGAGVATLVSLAFDFSLLTIETA